MEIKDLTKYTISQEEAQEWIRTWKAEQQEILKVPGLLGAEELSPLNIKAFTFTTDDLFDLCERIYNYNNPYEPPLNITRSELQDSVNAIRFYIGKKLSISIDPPEACLIAVPVIGFDPAKKMGGKDMITLPDFGGAGEGVPTIYDFSYPCPATCANRGESIMDGPIIPNK